jgi:hypothetical protein
MRGAAVKIPDLQPAIDVLSAAARERRAALAQDDLELTPMAVPAPAKRGA